MHRWWIPLIVCVLVTLGGGAAGALGKPLVSPVCIISKLSLNADTGAVNSAGVCKIAKTTVPSKWSFSYTTYDGDGYKCGDGLTEGQTNRFRVDSAAARATGRVTLKARSGKGRAVTRSFKLTLGGESLQCGRIANMPPPSQLCPWTDPMPGVKAFENCGVANSWIAWRTAPAIRENVVSAGHLVSRSGYCRFTTGRSGVFPPPQNFDWLGFHQQGQNVVCADGVLARGGVTYLEMVNPSGKRCRGVPPRSNSLLNFQIPSTWGGQLYVYFTLGVVDDYRSNDPKAVGFESQTVILQLSGTEDGCPLLSGQR